MHHVFAMDFKKFEKLYKKLKKNVPVCNLGRIMIRSIIERH